MLHQVCSWKEIWDVSLRLSTNSIRSPHVKCTERMKRVSDPLTLGPLFCCFFLAADLLLFLPSPTVRTQLLLLESFCLLSRASSRRSLALRFLYWQYSSAIGPRSSFWHVLLTMHGEKNAIKRQNNLQRFHTWLMVPMLPYSALYSVVGQYCWRKLTVEVFEGLTCTVQSKHPSLSFLSSL